MKRRRGRRGQETYTDRALFFKSRFFMLELVPLGMLLLVPMSVHAGVFSTFLSMLLQEETVVVKEEIMEQTVYDTPLLSATLNPDPLGVGGGDVFVDGDALVSTGPVGEDEIAESGLSGGEISVYTVRDGDSLSYVAEMYDVTVNTIVWANDLDGPTDIHAGDTLVILPIVGVRHTVKDGETFSEIIDKYDADHDEVLEYNNLTSVDQLSIGDELMIPGGSLHSTTRVAAAPVPIKTSGSVSSGVFAHPVPGSIKTQGIHGYNGVDFAASYGTPIRAAASGEVIVSKSSGWNGGYGSYVVVRHNNGTQTLYAHNSSNAVGVGEWVSQGQTIAYMGNSGRSTGTHLHFEVRGAANPF